ncbi:MAG: alkaline phosphatase family protein [Stagnimonas sp.]|nr:alkaline phosphatase family protein [Stagnimonas sp.]
MKIKSNGRGKRGLTRRDFITGAAATAGGLALSGCGEGGATAALGAGGLPAAKNAGFDKVVLVMLENRSFDHYLGWVPGADGVQAGTKLLDGGGTVRESYDLAPNYQNCDLADPDHSYEGGRTEINEGRMDGFLLTQPEGDAFPIGYYTADSLPFFKGCAEHWTICDRYFSGILAATTPNRFYMHAGQTDRASNTVDISSLPTVWDRMQGAGRSVAYWYTDVSYTSFWGDKYQGFSKKYDLDSFAAEVAANGLADLTYIDNVGSTLNEYGAISMDDHPYGDIRNGQAFLNRIYDVLRQSPDWERTLLIINYDEWGGFYDHVTPPFAPVTPEEFAATGNDGRLGCRVPCLILGPMAKRGHVEHTQFDPNSILNLLAWRFGFEPLGARASSNNLAQALNYTAPPRLDTPAFEVPTGPFGGLCVPLPLLADQVPLPLPAVPVSVGPVPLPVPVQLPPIPGLDVPVPGLPAPLATAIAAEARRRREDHDSELQALRELGSAFGF